MVIYHDDVTTGNILAPRKDNKCTLIYMGLRQMAGDLSREEAWLPVAFCLRAHVADVAGGLAAILRRVCLVLHSQEALLGFPLPLPRGSRWCVLARQSLFLADMDAQRATWAFRGSAGLKPCMHCFNVLAKGSGLAGGPFVEIDAPSLDACVAYRDAEIFTFADELAAMRGAGARAEKEKLYGFNHCPQGMLLDAACRLHLPPSAALTDAFHCYFANGCASWELGHMAECLRREGFALGTLLAAVQSAEWRRPGQGEKAWAGARLMFHPKMWESDTFKGDARDAWALVSLLHLLAEDRLGERPHCADKLRSFRLMQRICAELRDLRRMWQRIQPADVSALKAMQAEHQSAFVAAWGLPALKPKHRHRPRCCGGAQRPAQHRAAGEEAPVREGHWHPGPSEENSARRPCPSPIGCLAKAHREHAARVRCGRAWPLAS